MKKYLLTACLISFIAGFSEAQKAEVNKKGFFINRVKITSQTKMSVIDSLLGKPDRVSTLANTIWTYDKLGIYVYFVPTDSLVKQVNFELVKRELKFSPATSFSGSFVIHDNRITSAWPLTRLKKIKALKFDPLPVYLHPAYTSNLKIFFEFDEANTVLRSAGIALNFKEDVVNK